MVTASPMLTVPCAAVRRQWPYLREDLRIRIDRRQGEVELAVGDEEAVGLERQDVRQEAAPGP